MKSESNFIVHFLVTIQWPFASALAIFSFYVFMCVCIVLARFFFYFGGRFDDCKVYMFCLFVYYLLVIVFNAWIKKSIQPKSKTKRTHTHTHTWAIQEVLHNFQCVIAYWVFLCISVFLSVWMCFFVCLLQFRASQFIIWTRALFAVSNHTDLPNVTEYVMHIRIVHSIVYDSIVTVFYNFMISIHICILWCVGVYALVFFFVLFNHITLVFVQ